MAAPAAQAPASAIGPLLAKSLGDPTATVAIQADSAADATPLPASPASGTLAAGENALYSVDLAEGERIELTMPAPTSATPGEPAVFDLYLYAPGISELATATAVAHATEGPAARSLAYVVPTDAAGTYYIEVNAWIGAGDYELTYTIRAAGENTRQDIDAATPLALPGTANLTLADTWGANALYAVTLTAGTRVEIDLAGPAQADFDLYLYAPGTVSILPASVEPAAYANTPRPNERIVFDVPGGADGTYYLEVYRFNGGGDATLTISAGPIPAAPTATRVWGTSRYETAAAISLKAFPAGSRTAVVASGRSFADGLAASSLAGALNVPVLLAAPTALPAATATELTRLGVEKVYIVGGTAAVGAQVATAITALRPAPDQIAVERVSGTDRYATAAEVALKTREVTGTNPARIFLASGQNFPDALALSPVAYATATPILLTRAASLPPATADVIPQLKGTNHYAMDVLVAGGALAVGTVPASQAATLAGGTLTRAAGTSRYDTALAIAEHAVFAGWADPETVAVASGTAFPDALAGAPLPGMRGGTLLLTNPRTFSTAPEHYLRSFDFAVNEVWVIGGAAAVEEPVLTQIRTVLPVSPLAW